MSTTAFDEPPPRPGFAVLKRIGLAFLIIVLATAGGVAAVGIHEISDDIKIITNNAQPLPGIGPEDTGILDDVDPGGPQTILVLGSDRRVAEKLTGGTGRSDTMLLVRLDPDKGAIAVLSIPRDLRVTIPGYGVHKMNEAYADGGPALTVKTIRELLHVPISHVVNINFGGFTRAINRLGCIFTDVDRRYYNDNMPPAGGGGVPYAVIDIKAGYQRLCGDDALSYVRFRHLDNDLVRSARQQAFVGQAKDQVGFGKLFSSRKDLLKIFARYTQTDLRSRKAILRLLSLAFASIKNPVQEVQFQPVSDIPGTTELGVSPGTLKRLARQFMNAKASTGKSKRTSADRDREKQQRRQKRKKRKANTNVPAGLFDAKQVGEDMAIRLATDPKVTAKFPIYYPRLAKLGSSYRMDDNRIYRIRDRDKKNFQAYRMVASAPGTGQYYGVQGMTWRDPPLLDGSYTSKTVNGRSFRLYKDGNRLSIVAWKTPKAVYWVSNTLSQVLTNKEMLAIASSLTRPGT